MSEEAVKSNTPVEDALRLDIIRKVNGYKNAAKDIPFTLIEKLNIALQANKDLYVLYGDNIYPGIVAREAGEAYANVSLRAKPDVVPRDAIKVLIKVLGGTFKRIQQSWNTATSEWTWAPKGVETGLCVTIITGLPQTCTVERTEAWIPAAPGSTHIDSNGQIMVKSVTSKVVCTNDKEVSE
jgi:hypothetical protein